MVPPPPTFSRMRDKVLFNFLDRLSMVAPQQTPTQEEWVGIRSAVAACKECTRLHDLNALWFSREQDKLSAKLGGARISRSPAQQAEDQVLEYVHGSIAYMLGVPNDYSDDLQSFASYTLTQLMMEQMGVRRLRSVSPGP